MALPLSRNTTYTNPSQVKSADLNDLQDQVINLYAGKRGERTDNIFLTSPSLQAGGTYGLIVAGGHYWIASAGSVDGYFPLTLRVGERIKTMRIQYYGGGGSAPAIELRQGSPGTAPSAVGSSWGSASSGVETDLTSATLNHTVLATTSYLLKVTSGNTNDRFGRLAIVTDIP